MDNKKLAARKEMLKRLSSEKRQTVHEGLGKELSGKKKFQKVEVASDSPEGLEKGLSLAQQLMEARFGEKLDKKKSEGKLASIEGDEEEHEGCPICDGEGCKLCEDEDAVDETEEQ